MQLREVKELYNRYPDHHLNPKDFGRFALLIAIFNDVSCKQAFKILDEELKKDNSLNYHTTYSRGW